MDFRTSAWCAVFCGLVLAAIGCGYKADLPPMAEVEGTVTLDGSPLPRAMIQFSPDAKKGTRGAAGVAASDEKCHFEVVTAGVKGALIGHHKISVEARQTPRSSTDSMPPSLIPTKYNNPASSGLSTEVKKKEKGEKNEVNLPLSSKR